MFISKNEHILLLLIQVKIEHQKRETIQNIMELVTMHLSYELFYRRLLTQALEIAMLNRNAIP